MQKLPNGSDRTDQSTPRHSRAAVRLLTGPELLALQLTARGYSPEQVARLTGGDERTVSDALAGAVWALDARDVNDAVANARVRRLIL